VTAPRPLPKWEVETAATRFGKNGFPISLSQTIPIDIHGDPRPGCACCPTQRRDYPWAPAPSEQSKGDSRHHRSRTHITPARIVISRGRAPPPLFLISDVPSARLYDKSSPNAPTPRLLLSPLPSSLRRWRDHHHNRPLKIPCIAGARKPAADGTAGLRHYTRSELCPMQPPWLDVIRTLNAGPARRENRSGDQKRMVVPRVPCSDSLAEHAFFLNDAYSRITGHFAAANSSPIINTSNRPGPAFLARPPGRLSTFRRPLFQRSAQ